VGPVSFLALLSIYLISRSIVIGVWMVEMLVEDELLFELESLEVLRLRLFIRSLFECFILGRLLCWLVPEETARVSLGRHYFWWVWI